MRLKLYVGMSESIKKVIQKTCKDNGRKFKAKKIAVFDDCMLKDHLLNFSNLMCIHYDNFL